MKTTILCVLASAALIQAAAAQPVRPPASAAQGATQLQVFLPPPDATEIKAPRPHRVMSIPSALAVKGAQAAVDACKAQGVDTASVVIDSQGIPIALIAADDTPAMVERIVMGKAYSALKTGMPSTAAMEKAKTDAAFAAQYAADPMTGPFRGGGFPIMAGGRSLGAIAISGGKTVEQEDSCAQAGLAVIQSQLK